MLNASSSKIVERNLVDASTHRYSSYSFVSTIMYQNLGPLAKQYGKQSSTKDWAEQLLQILGMISVLWGAMCVMSACNIYIYI